MEEIIKKIVSQIKQKTDIKPEIAIVLGSGLSDILEDMTDKIVINYSELEGMLKTSVEGHKNQFIIGKINGVGVISMLGRFHLYDGFSAKQVSMPIYIFKELGVKTLITTNSAGGVREDLNAGDIAVLTDHINRTGTNCLIGGANIYYGEQFVDMTEPYDVIYRQKVLEIASKYNINLKQGVYVQFLGPFYETKAEIKMAKIIGGDIVGMSTVLEVEAARQCNIRVLGLSVITNKATGLSSQKLSHSEVLQNSKLATKNLIKIIKEFIKDYN